MNEISGKPKTTTEIEPVNDGILIVGEKSFLGSQLREILASCGIKINDLQGFNYIFQLGDFEKIEFFLKKATGASAKFLLILNEDVDTKLSKKAEEAVEKFIQAQKLNAKIIKLSGFAGEEIEAVKKILKIAFSHTSQKTFSLTGPGTFWEKSKKSQGAVAKKRFIFWGILSALLLFLLTFPITFILANIFLGTVNLKNAREAVFSSKFEEGKREALSAQEHFTSAENGFGQIVPVFYLLGREEQVREIENWFKIGQDLGGATRHLVEVGQEGQKLARLILGQAEGRIDELLARVAADVSLVEGELALIEARTVKKPPVLDKNLEQIGSLRKNLVKFKNLLGVAPWVLGLGEKRTYLVLFQNNFELRPGGGFIGTIGFLTFTDGKLDLQVEDVYTADGQLRGHVEPPKPIKNYLGQIHWYLRDSNWEPDFPTNARQAAWFLEKELGIRPDGVIAVDLAFVKKILALTGPVDLGDYQEKISSENLFLKAQIYSQEGFFPGSTQKKDFLSSLTHALFTKLAMENRQPAVSWLGMGKTIEEAAQEKHLFVFLKNELAQKLVSEQGLGGEVKNVKCPAPNGKCLDDYLMIVEANLGVNKSNYFVKREIKKETEFENDGIRSKIVLVYENTSPVNISFGGVYKNYLRILLPASSILEKIKIDRQELDLAREIDKTTAFGKIATGFLVEVPAGNKKEVEVLYKIPLDSSWEEFTYQFLVQKQPGTENDPFGLQIFASGWRVLETNFPVAKSGTLSYNGDLSVDRFFKIRLTRGPL
ncbi:MAG: Uncharacterized protein LiPW16_115 [Microgenomates group bacterium LiPW_16]|nr:MAG: Uncharacterized protein LiPW16_115 [Microgenomates group bacterium LiPW_16]